MKREIDRLPVARYRLSPNEEARLLKAERDKKKKQRLLMVRQQAKEISKNILKDVKAEKQRQIEILAEEIKDNFAVNKELKLEQLEKLYEKNLKHVGEAHVAAVQEDVDGKQEDHLLVKHEDARVTLERGKKALEKLKTDLLQKEMAETRHIRARQDAIQKEKERSAYIASKPPPEKDPVDELQIAKMKPVKFTDHDSFSTTHYHIPAEYGVVKEDQQTQDNAKVTAETEGERYEDTEAEKRRVEIERREKARVRHKVALQKERLHLDYDNILHELSDLQKSDRIRRQKVVANLPKQIFVPPSNRIEDLESQQKGMERAFEDMFIAGQPGAVKELILDCPPAPLTSDESSVTTLDESVPRPPPTELGKDVTTSVGESTARHILDTTNKAPDSGLKSLLGKIKSQREAWVRSSNGHPASGSCDQSLTQFTEETASKPGSRAATERSEVETLSTGEVDSRSTMSTKSQSLGETLRTSMEEGSVTSSGTITESRPTQSDIAEYQTLNHPLEKAAQLRQSQNGMSEHLIKERLQQQQISRENQAIKQEAESRRQQLETQKKELENKLRELEMKRLALHSRSQEASSQVSQPPPSKSVPASGVGILPTDHSTSHIIHPPVIESQKSSLLDMTHSSTFTGSSSVDIARIREYQDRILRRQGNAQEQMQQARQDLQRRVEDMLAKAKSDYNGSIDKEFEGKNSVPVQLPTFPRVSPLPETSPLGYFKDISPRLSGMQEERLIEEGRGPHTRLPLRSSTGSSAEARVNADDLVSTGSRSFQDEQSLHRKVLEQQVAAQQVKEQNPETIFNGLNQYPHGYGVNDATSVPRLNSGLVNGMSSSAYSSFNRTSGGTRTEQTFDPASAQTDPISAKYDQTVGPYIAKNGQTMNTLSARTEPITDPLSARTDHTLNTLSALTDHFSAPTDLTVDPLSARTDPTFDPISAQSDQVSAWTDRTVDSFSNQSENSDYRQLDQPGTLATEAKMHIDIPPTTYVSEALTLPSSQPSTQPSFQPSVQPTLQPAYDFERRRDLSTIIEVDSPEKTALSRMSAIGETNGVGTPESSPVWKEKPSDRESSQSMHLKTGERLHQLTSQESRTLAQHFEEDSIGQPRLYGDDLTLGSTTDTADLSQPKLTRNWHDILAENSQASSIDQQPYAEQTRGIPVGESQPVPSRLSQYRQDIVIGAEEDSINQLLPAVSSGFVPQTSNKIGAEEDSRNNVLPFPPSGFGPHISNDIFRTEEENTNQLSSVPFSDFAPLENNDREEDSSNQVLPVPSRGFIPGITSEIDNTFASTIPDDLPRDRNEFLELQECSSSEKEFHKSTTLRRPLSSTPARKDTNVGDFRKAILKASQDSHQESADATLQNQGRYSDIMPSEIFSHHMTSITTTTQQTPSTLKTQEMSQYTFGSGSSVGGESRRSGESVRSMENDLTQYTSGVTSQLPSATSGTLTTPVGTSTGLQFDAMSIDHSAKSADQSTKFGQLSAEYSSQFEPISTEISSKTYSGSGSSSENVFSEEERQVTEQSKVPVVRFASGDPDVRMMSASSSEVGQSLISQGQMSYTSPGFSLPSTGIFGRGLTDSSRPLTIGENREESGGQLVSSGSRPVDDLTRRIEETMKKHEKLLEESKRMSERHEEEQKKSVAQEVTADDLEFTQETGITDEPDLTLLSATSESLSRHGNPDANSSGKITDVSLLSFEQHEKSLALTPSDHTSDLKTGDTNNSLLSFEKHERSFGSSQEGSNGYDRIFGMHKISPTPLEGSSPLPLLPLSSETTDPSNLLTLTTTTADITPASPQPIPTETLSSAGSDTTLTPRVETALCEWERDEFTPLRMEEGTQEDNWGDNRGFDPSHAVISIPVGQVDDSSEQDSVQGLSLQEVFAKKKANLIRNSQQRQETAKVKAKQSAQPGHMTKTMAHWKKSRGLGKGSQPSKIPSPTKMVSKSSQDRKQEEREMKQRTSRLYNRLEDVKDKKQEEDRKQQYAANRERAKDYNKKLQESRLKKKAEGK